MVSRALRSSSSVILEHLSGSGPPRTSLYISCRQWCSTVEELVTVVAVAAGSCSAWTSSNRSCWSFFLHALIPFLKLLCTNIFS